MINEDGPNMSWSLCQHSTMFDLSFDLYIASLLTKLPRQC